MAVFVVSDIHGQYDAFLRLLDKMGFDDANDNMLYILGDMVDRGPDSISVLRKVKDNPRMVAIKGNHESFLLDYFMWLEKGYESPYYHYNTATMMEEEMSNVDRQEMLTWIRNLPLQIDITIDDRKFVLAHGATHYLEDDENYYIPEDFTMPDEEWYIQRVCMDYDQVEYTSVVGHTSTIYLHNRINEDVVPGKIYRNKNDNTILIDCGAAYPEMSSSCLGAICLDTMEEYYVEI